MFDKLEQRRWEENKADEQKAEKQRGKEGRGEEQRWMPSDEAYEYQVNRFGSRVEKEKEFLSEMNNAEEKQYVNHLNEKYLLGDKSWTGANVRAQLKRLLQSKTSEVEALRVHRDQLRLVSLNRPEQQSIKLSLAVLKQKAKVEEQIWDMVNYLRKSCSDLSFQINQFDQYFNFLRQKKDTANDTVVIDTAQSERLLIDNLELKTEHFLAQLNEEDETNNQSIKSMQKQIENIRIALFEKEQFLKHLRSNICALHMKMNAKIKKHTEANILCSETPCAKEQFVGNELVRQYSKYLRDPKTESELIKIVIIYTAKNNGIYVKCVYDKGDGMVHDIQQRKNNRLNLLSNKKKREPYIPKVKKPKRTQSSKQIDITKEGTQYGEQSELIEVFANTIISMKVCMVNRIVGFQFKVRGDLGERTLIVGKVHSNEITSSKLVAVGNKKIVSLASYWYQNYMIGVGFQLVNKPREYSSVIRSQRSLSGINRQDSYQNILGATNKSQMSIKRKSMKTIKKEYNYSEYYGKSQKDLATKNKNHNTSKIGTFLNKFPSTFHTEAYRSGQFSAQQSFNNQKTSGITSRLANNLYNHQPNSSHEYYDY